MKTRDGFVSNSSSSSFVLPKKYLSKCQLGLIHAKLVLDEPEGWDITEDDEAVRGFTHMDNYDYVGFLIDEVEVKPEHIEVERD